MFVAFEISQFQKYEKVKYQVIAIYAKNFRKS